MSPLRIYFVGRAAFTGSSWMALRLAAISALRASILFWSNTGGHQRGHGSFKVSLLM